MTSGFFDAFLPFSRTGVRRLPRTPPGLESLATTHTQPTPQSFDVGMLSGRATRPGADGTVCTPAGDTTVQSPLPLLCAAFSISQEEARPSKTQRYDKGCHVERSVLGDVGGAQSQTNLEFHIPSGGRCSTTSRFKSWIGNGDSPSTRQRRHGSPILVVGCSPEKEELGCKQRARTGTNTAVESQQIMESWPRMSESCGRSARNIFAKSCW